MLHHLDFDECVVSNGGCEQQCINRIPSFECRCDDGYTLDSDGFNCSGMFNSSISLIIFMNTKYQQQKHLYLQSLDI